MFSKILKKRTNIKIDKILADATQGNFTLISKKPDLMKKMDNKQLYALLNASISHGNTDIICSIFSHEYIARCYEIGSLEESVGNLVDDVFDHPVLLKQKDDACNALNIVLQLNEHEKLNRPKSNKLAHYKIDLIKHIKSRFPDSEDPFMSFLSEIDKLDANVLPSENPLKIQTDQLNKFSFNKTETERLFNAIFNNIKETVDVIKIINEWPFPMDIIFSIALECKRFDILPHIINDISSTTIELAANRICECMKNDNYDLAVQVLENAAQTYMNDKHQLKKINTLDIDLKKVTMEVMLNFLDENYTSFSEFEKRTVGSGIIIFILKYYKSEFNEAISDKEYIKYARNCVSTDNYLLLESIIDKCGLSFLNQISLDLINKDSTITKYNTNSPYPYIFLKSSQFENILSIIEKDKLNVDLKVMMAYGMDMYRILHDLPRETSTYNGLREKSFYKDNKIFSSNGEIVHYAENVEDNIKILHNWGVECLEENKELLEQIMPQTPAVKSAKKTGDRETSEPTSVMPRPTTERVSCNISSSDMNGHVDIIEEIIEEKEEDLPSLLENAIKTFNFKSTKKLISKIENKPSLLNKTLYDVVLNACQFKQNNKQNVNLIKQLIKKGADINQKDQDGYNLIDIAIKHRNTSVAKAFVKKGVPITEGIINMAGKYECPNLKKWLQNYQQETSNVVENINPNNNGPVNASNDNVNSVQERRYSAGNHKPTGPGLF
ncbi:MAG: hypothetical protein IPP74_09265 [Alphaproteobacteria bacterium]|nr:hypothetical protein [Alphaproteobacteria bacterium]